MRTVASEGKSKSPLQSIAVLASGAVIGQGLVLASTPFLSRLYDPVDFGSFALFLSVVGVVQVFATLRLELAIPLPNSDLVAKRLFAAGMLASVAVSIATMVLLVLFESWVREYLNPQGVPYFAVLVGLAVAGAATFQLLTYWAVRFRLYSGLAVARFTRPAITVAVQLAAFSLGPLGLLAGASTGLFIAPIVMSRPRFTLRGASVLQRARSVWGAVVRYRRFPLYSTWAALLGSLGMHLAPVILAASASVAAAGVFALALRVLAGPTALLGQALGDVFYREALEADRKGRLGEIVILVDRLLAQLAAPAALLLVVVAPELFAFVFGEEWRQAGVLAAILTPMVYLQFLNAPLGSIFQIRERQDLSLWLQGAMGALRLGGILLGGAMGAATGAVIGFSLAASIGYVGFILGNNAVAGNNAWPILRDNLAAWARAGLIVAPTVAVLFLPAPPLFWVGALTLTAFLLARHYLLLLREYRSVHAKSG